MPFRPIEHTADLGIEVRAASLGALFVDAAAGLCDAIADVATIGERQEVAVELAEPALDLLLVSWLEELLYRFDTAALLLPHGEAAVDELPGAFRVRARLRGERLDARRHAFKVHVKAITYHGLEVAREGEEWRARVIFDI